MKLGAEKKKRSGLGLGIGALVLAVVGVGGYLAFAHKSAAPQASQPPAPPPVTAPVETLHVAAQPQPAPAPPRTDPRRQTTPPAAPPSARAAQGFVSVNSNPPGNLFIDGRDLGSVPVIEEPVSAGRHTIRIERAGFKTKTDVIDVPANNTIRRTYVLEPEGE
jgi:hypothetical protein